MTRGKHLFKRLRKTYMGNTKFSEDNTIGWLQSERFSRLKSIGFYPKIDYAATGPAYNRIGNTLVAWLYNKFYEKR